MKLSRQSQKIVSMLYAPPGLIQKGIRIMKITAILLLAFCMQVSATVFAQKITLSEKNANLVDVLSQIRRQSGYDVIYRNDLLSKSKPVTVNLIDASLDEALKASLQNQQLAYEIQDGAIIIKEAEPSFIDNLKNKIKAEFAQVTVTGKVTDETGAPLLGVTVKIKNTNIATATDGKGIYSIAAPDNNSIVVFSFIGYESQELPAKDVSNGSTIIMKATQTNLREVVVNKGYYSERQRRLANNP